MKIEDLIECPKCRSDLKGEPIPEDLKEQYGGSNYYSKLIAIEIPELYDGVSFWKCPFCKTTWDRWTGEETEIPKGKVI